MRRRLLAALVALSMVAATPPSLRVGHLTLARCSGVEAWCGTLERPLDPTGRVPGTIGIHFEYYPATGPRTGTLVAAEGGPGYPSTGSRAEYLALFAPLRATRDLVLMDDRGTGGSGAIDCAPLQRADAIGLALIDDCGARLGERAPLYSTSYAADDLEAILAALDAGPIDLYGDSYGTFFAQVFAVRHPGRLRSLTLDGAYPLDGPDLAWWPNYAPAMRDKFNRACERDPVCAMLPGWSLLHIAPALAALREQPHDARAFDADGAEQRFRADAAALAIVMFGAAPAYATLRETDAAARAYATGDHAPLERLMAEARSAVLQSDAAHAPELFSQGLAVAVMCQDAPQVFDMRLPPESRRLARDAAFAARRASAPASYAPFTLDEYRRMPPDYAFIEQCVGWPAHSPAHPSAYQVAAERGFPDIPVLVVSGELDNMTSVADAELAARQYRHARHLVLANSLHVNALPHARSTCGAELVRRFVATLDPGDTRCTGAIDALRLALPFVRASRYVTAAEALPGNRVDAEGLKLAAAALATAGDLFGRLLANGSGHGVGLRGGTFTVRTTGTVLAATLADVRWVEDVAVSGALEFQAGADSGSAELRFTASDGRRGEFHAAWPAGGPAARARLTGTVEGRTLNAEARAP